MTTENRIYPVRGQTYTLAEVAKLYLRDSAHLQIMPNDRLENVQFSEDLADICKGNVIISESRWTYIRETDEWIPIFRFASDNEFPLESVVTIVPTRWTGTWARQENQSYVRFIGDNTPELTEFEEEILSSRLATLLPLDQLKELAKVDPTVMILDVPPTGSWESSEFAKACGYGQVTESTPAPVRVSFPIEEMLKDPLKAKAYVDDRTDNAKTMLADLEWDCSNENDLDKAKLYFAGTIQRYKASHTLRSVYWGMVDLREQLGKKQAPVYFKTEECFTAWVLARFW